MDCGGTWASGGEGLANATGGSSCVILVSYFRVITFTSVQIGRYSDLLDLHETEFNAGNEFHVGRYAGDILTLSA